MIRAGMSVARLNFSHGDHETHLATINLLRQVAREEKANLAILMDLQGPRLRIGPIAAGQATLEAGQRFSLTTRQVAGDAHEVLVEGVNLPSEVGPGNTILIDDGLLELTVLDTNETDVVCRVVTGGPLRPRKGINVLGVTLGVPSITEKDEKDLAFGVKHGVDFVALSFVRSARDIITLKKRLSALGSRIPVIAKIEKHEAVTNFDEILAAADGIMVARGDLATETSPESVPIVQKMVIRKCNAVGKPVITATQMLNSMIDSPRPTRAEASDVANAIFDGTDAVMLSGETSIGQYPVLSVKMMASIATTAEQSLPYGEMTRRLSKKGNYTVTDAIGQATVEIAEEINAKAILTMTESGYTARMVARHRPSTPIIGLTPNEETLRRLALSWGVRPVLVGGYDSVDELFATAERAATASGFAHPGETVVITAGLPVGRGGGRTNVLKVHYIEEGLQ